MYVITFTFYHFCSLFIAFIIITLSTLCPRKTITLDNVR